MHILVVTQYFWPENFRVNDLCSELVARGHKVTVLTGVPNYPKGAVLPEYTQNPQLYSEYQGVEIMRVPMLTRGEGSSVNLLLNYISYALSASILGPIKLRNRSLDLIFVFEPSPVTVGIPAVVIKKIKKVPIVFWVLDLWPETLQAVGVVKSKIFLKIIGRLVSYIYNHSDLVLGQSKAFLKGIESYCSDEAKIKYFPSWSESIFSNTVGEPIHEIVQHEGCFKVLFAGNVGEAQDFPSILNAAASLKSIKAKIKFFIVGDGRMSSWVDFQIQERGLDDYIILLGRQPLEIMPDFYASADALLVSLKSSEIFSMTIPGKVQTYMAARKPILAMLDGEGARAINRAGAGLVCRSEDFKGLVDNVIEMSTLSGVDLLKMAENAKTYADKEFDRDKLITQLEQWFSDICTLSKSPPR